MESGMESGPLWAQRHMNSYVIWDHIGPSSYGPKSLYIYICAHVFFLPKNNRCLLLFPPAFSSCFSSCTHASLVGEL